MGKLYSIKNRYVFEMKNKTEPAFEFRNRLEKSLAKARTQRRGVPAALATTLWVLDIKRRRQTFSLYALEKLFEPESFGHNEHGEAYHHNKWTKYEVGLHTPNDKLVQQVDAKLPGTAHLLRHPFWTLVQTKNWDTNKAEGWLRKLSTEIRAVLQNRSQSSTFREVLSVKIGSKQIKMLERRASLDALAAQVVFLFNAISAQDDELIRELCESVFRTLLILGSFAPYSFVGDELFQLVCECVFSRATWKGVSFDFSEYDFFKAAMQLEWLVLSLEDNGVVNAVAPAADIRVKLRLLDGEFGFDIRFAMRPPVKPVSPRCAENEHIYKNCESNERYRQWGLAVLREGRCEQIPPLWLVHYPDHPPPTANETE